MASRPWPPESQHSSPYARYYGKESARAEEAKDVEFLARWCLCLCRSDSWDLICYPIQLPVFGRTCGSVQQPFHAIDKGVQTSAAELNFETMNTGTSS